MDWERTPRLEEAWRLDQYIRPTMPKSDRLILTALWVHRTLQVMRFHVPRTVAAIARLIGDLLPDGRRSHFDTQWDHLRRSGIAARQQVFEAMTDPAEREQFLQAGPLDQPTLIHHKHLPFFAAYTALFDTEWMFDLKLAIDSINPKRFDSYETFRHAHLLCYQLVSETPNVVRAISRGVSAAAGFTTEAQLDAYFAANPWQPVETPLTSVEIPLRNPPPAATAPEEEPLPLQVARLTAAIARMESGNTSRQGQGHHGYRRRPRPGRAETVVALAEKHGLSQELVDRRMRDNVCVVCGTSGHLAGTASCKGKAPHQHWSWSNCSSFTTYPISASLNYVT